MGLSEEQLRIEALNKALEWVRTAPVAFSAADVVSIAEVFYQFIIEDYEV